MTAAPFAPLQIQAPEWAADPEDDHPDLPCVATPLDKAFSRPGDRADAAAGGDGRRIRQAEVVSTAEEKGDRPESEVAPAADDEDEEEVQEERRRRIRQRREEEIMPREKEEEETVAEDEEPECETDSEEDDSEVMCVAVVKPVFVQRSHRDTIAEKKRILEEKWRLQELVRKRMEKRKVETRRIVVEVIMEEEQIEKAGNQGAADTMDIDTDDELNAEDEYEAWKNREVSRIRAREARLRVRGETKMELERTDRKQPAQLKERRKFLQKYYHKGAFFQEEPDDGRQTFGLDDIYMRDFSEATAEDKMNKSILPQVMQVKNFGRKGRPKWTHLCNEDTTRSSIPYVL